MCCRTSWEVPCRSSRCKQSRISQGGVVVTETVFGYPGIGSGLVSAVGAQDMPLVTAIVVIVSSAYIVANTLADVINIVLNPRLRRGAP